MEQKIEVVVGVVVDLVFLLLMNLVELEDQV
jgi:hypothetical protein